MRGISLPGVETRKNLFHEDTKLYIVLCGTAKQTDNGTNDKGKQRKAEDLSEREKNYF